MRTVWERVRNGGQVCQMLDVICSEKLQDLKFSLEGCTQITPWLSVLFHSGVLFSSRLPEVAKARPGEEGKKN